MKYESSGKCLPDVVISFFYSFFLIMENKLTVCRKEEGNSLKSYYRKLGKIFCINDIGVLIEYILKATLAKLVAEENGGY